VSDIVAYNKDKMKATTDAASLRTEFREEIRKSWEEYANQVGSDFARQTTYFRDALNEILAEGATVF
jgi:NAD dependent epimerase/dehydratase family enzyme